MIPSHGVMTHLRWSPGIRRDTRHLKFSNEMYWILFTIFNMGHIICIWLNKSVREWEPFFALITHNFGRYSNADWHCWIFMAMPCFQYERSCNTQLSPRGLIICVCICGLLLCKSCWLNRNSMTHRWHRDMYSSPVTASSSIHPINST